MIPSSNLTPAPSVTASAGGGEFYSFLAWKKVLLGAALMVYGYFVSNVWLSLLVGCVLTALIFFPR